MQFGVCFLVTSGSVLGESVETHTYFGPNMDPPRWDASSAGCLPWLGLAMWTWEKVLSVQDGGITE